MPDKPLSLQDNFLNSARKSKLPLTIFLMKGVKLQGVITWFDTFSVLLRRDGRSQLVYKHSISTIVAGKPFAPPPPAEEGGRQSLQEVFLSAAARDGQSMAVFLVNGVMLQGSVVAHDQFSVLLERGGQAQLVYKHAISTLQPEEPLALGGEPEDAEPVEEGS
ncbi:MAG: RNA chaperone Hfq [Pseudomonadota bacterium]|nr:RNA chaperone Hfq [Sphingomonas sp.]MDQ3479638.1 RNA chaperone Hfq [Pseudomonadota bacterium]